MTQAQQGDTVLIDYKIHKSDGTLVGDTSEAGPQPITIGEGAIFPKIEEKLTEMKVGDQQKVEIASDNAFGPRRDDMVIDIPRQNLPAEPAPEPGMALQAQQQDGSSVTLYVLDVNEEAVKADANHPLAGEDLTFDVTLREIRAAA
ncbi:MAG: FKBP-type peptidyl-prolyl cis-trans isomerase [Erythrobacter sp.]|uniref:FKBP-type peptidyl-prolyl cis-trans isomerase n=1 Tax=Erythrobacter sp. TaxID=1042 RepID=UPI003C74CD18